MIHEVEDSVREKILDMWANQKSVYRLTKEELDNLPKDYFPRVPSIMI